MKRLLIISFLLFASTALFAAKNVDFYGHVLPIRNHVLSSEGLDQVNETTLNRFESSLNYKYMNGLYREFDSLTLAYNLDDVGTVQLSSRISKVLYSDNNRSQFIRYSLLVHKGYRVVLTYSNNQLSTFGVLGFSPSNAVYIMLHGEKFSNLDFKDYRLAGNRKIYGNDLSGRAIFLNASKKPRLDKKKRTRKLIFRYDNRTIEINARGNESLMEYIRDLPTLDFNRIYLDYGISDDLRNTLFVQLEQEMVHMSQREKLSFLLVFTQQAFRYASDQTTYGTEKYNFPEETIFESYSDCDDRVILLASLYKELLGLNSVALLFSSQNHLSLAVHVPNTTVGGSFKYEGKSYYVCEPTGINYNLGRSAYPLSQISKVYKLY